MYCGYKCVMKMVFGNKINGYVKNLVPHIREQDNYTPFPQCIVNFVTMIKY